MILGDSREASGESTDRHDLPTCWACHQQASACLPGVPDELRQDRTQTVGTRSVGQPSALHPDAIACAGPDGGPITLCRPRRPVTKGNVEKPVDPMREWVFRGRAWTDRVALNRQWPAWHDEAWLPHRHRTTGATSAARRLEDWAALRPPPPQPYAVCEGTPRHGGQDCRFSVEGSLSSAPAACAGPRMALRICPDQGYL